MRALFASPLILASLCLSMADGYTPPAGSVGIAGATRGAAIQSPRPSVVLMVLDDVGWSELASMPRLQSLAAQGMTFNGMIVHPTCTPTRLALLTGAYPRREGIGDLSMNAFQQSEDRLPMERVTLAELLTPTHHTTAIGKWHLGRGAIVGQMNQVPSGPFCWGFEKVTALNPTVPSVGVVTGGATATGFYQWFAVEDGLMQLNFLYATDVQRDAFLDTWGTSSDPEFTYLAWSAAHDSPPGVWETPPGMNPSLTLRAQYLDVVRYLDGAIGDVLPYIDLSTTYLFVLGDNGTPESVRPSGGVVGHFKGSTLLDGVRVPFFVAGPGIIPGSNTGRLVSDVDVAATIAELVGVTPGRGFEDSQSFANTLNPNLWAGTPPRSFVFTERYKVVASGEYPQPDGWDSRAIYEAQWAYTINDEDGNGPGGKTELVYNLVQDPGQIAGVDPASIPASFTVPQQNAIKAAAARMRAELAQMPARKP